MSESVWSRREADHGQLGGIDKTNVIALAGPKHHGWEMLGFSTVQSSNESWF